MRETHAASHTIRIGRHHGAVCGSEEAPHTGQGTVCLVSGFVVFGLALLLAFPSRSTAESTTTLTPRLLSALLAGIPLNDTQIAPPQVNSLPACASPTTLSPECRAGSSVVSSARSVAPEMEPFVRFVRPVGRGSQRGLRWGFLAGAGTGTAAAAWLSSRRSSDVTQLSAALGTWVGSILVGFLIGHATDPLVARTTWPPLVDLRSSFADTDGNGMLSGVEEGRVHISIANRGRGKAKNVRLGVALLESGVPVKSEYRGGTDLGCIEGDCDRRVTILVRPQTELPRNHFTIGITCSYETEWGVPAEETQRISFTSATNCAE
jgi:hypothetical protein